MGLADPAEWQLNEHGAALMKTARVESLKVNAPGCTQDVFNLARGGGVQHFICRMMGNPVAPDQFVKDCLLFMNVAYANGVRVFEVHNEPNAPVEGYGRYWTTGAGFAGWWSEVAQLVRDAMPPDVKLLLPCPSPDESWRGPQEFHTFLDATLANLSVPYDGLAVHAYGPAENIISAVRTFANDHRDKPVYVTEFSNKYVPHAEQGRQYRMVYEAAHPNNVVGLYGFVLQSSGDDWREEIWTAAVAEAVGERV